MVGPNAQLPPIKCNWSRRMEATGRALWPRGRDSSRLVSPRSQGSLVTRRDTVALSPKLIAQSPRSFSGADHFPTHGHDHKCHPVALPRDHRWPDCFPPEDSRCYHTIRLEIHATFHTGWSEMVKYDDKAVAMRDRHAGVGCSERNRVIIAPP